MIYQMVMSLTQLSQFTQSALQPMNLRSALHTLFCCRICTCEGLLFSVSNRTLLGYPLPFILPWNIFQLLTLSLFQCNLCRVGTHDLLVTPLEIVQTAERSRLSNSGVESCSIPLQAMCTIECVVSTSVADAGKDSCHFVPCLIF